MRDFRKLLAWQKADDLAIQVYRVTEDFPRDERFGLTLQMRRAVVSVAANIAEGCGRDSLTDFRRFLHQARGSLYEVDYYGHLTARLGYLEPGAHDPLLAACGEAEKILQGLINSITHQINTGRKTN